MVNWLLKVLNTEILAPSERSGAAQGYSEMISVHGPHFFEEQVKKIIEYSRNENPFIRESYRQVLVYLPTSFEKFVTYLPALLPVMIEGLSDEMEDVRKVSMRNVKICIK